MAEAIFADTVKKNVLFPLKFFIYYVTAEDFRIFDYIMGMDENNMK
uniref:Uncharacterized protein n=1 Tax=Parascaris equorum TaxID=6256 RepID=A0A914RTY6_PAREQ